MKRDAKYFGERSVRALFAARPQSIKRVFVRKGEEGRYKELLSSCAQKRLPYELVDQEKLSVVAHGEHHEGIVVYADVKPAYRIDTLLEEFKASSLPHLLVLDGVENPHNIGGILRSAHFFAYTYVVICSKTKVHLQGSLARVSEGGSEYCKIAFVSDAAVLAEKLVQNQVSVIVSVPEPRGDLSGSAFEKQALILGSERSGVSEALYNVASQEISIPRALDAEMQSLNVSVAAGILLYGMSQ